MNEHSKVYLYIAVIPLVAVIIIYLVSEIKLDTSLSPLEKRILEFHQESVPVIAEKKPLDARAVRSPFVLKNAAVKGFPETPLTSISPQPSEAKQIRTKRVSMILLNSSRKTAIIDGDMVHEGDSLNHYRVLKIEKGKVLIKSKEGEQWLKLE